jgi:transmembrane sensor
LHCAQSAFATNEEKGDPMTGPVEDRDAGQDAASWLVRLNKPVVDSAALTEFFAWRRVPGNAEAYSRAEKSWHVAQALRDDPEIAGALGDALARPSQRLRPRLAMAGIGALVMAVLVAGLFWTMRPLAYETRVGEQSAIRLEDGTRVRLDTDTRLEVKFASGVRQVRLARGQALFDVAHDATRPFKVDAGLTEVHALGTEFDVRRDSRGVLVALFAGKVGLGKPGATPTQTLAPGQRIEVTRAGPGAVSPADRAALTGWTEGRIQFDRTPLGTAVAEVNRYAARPVVLDTPRFSSERVTGGFDTGDSAAFVEAVTALYPLAAARDADGTIRLVERR